MNLLTPDNLKKRGTIRVSILAFDGVDELDLFGVYSILSKARNSVIGVAQIWSLTGSVLATGDIEIQTRVIDNTMTDCDVLVVPGGSGAWDTARSGIYNAVIARAYLRNVRIYCCCSGALIVAAALTPNQGRMAIHSRKKKNLRAFFGGQIVSGMVDSKGIFTIGGQPFDGVKSVLLAFKILRDLDANVSRRIAERTEISWSTANALQ